MNDLVRQDIIKILEDALGILELKDSIGLRELSDHTLHNASIFQDKDSISIAVIIYSLSKIIDRMGKIEPEVFSLLKKAMDSLKKNSIDEYSLRIRKLIKLISGFDKKLNLYIQHVMDEAEIKKGSRIYEHGISLAKTA